MSHLTHASYESPPDADLAEFTFIARITGNAEMFVGVNGGSAGAGLITDVGTILSVAYFGSVDSVSLSADHAVPITTPTFRVYLNGALAFGPIGVPLAPLLPRRINTLLALPRPPIALPSQNLVSVSVEFPLGETLPSAVWGTIALTQERQ